jgi:hypothetical protein
MFWGGGIAKGMCIERHKNLAYEQLKKRCWIVSKEWQTKHVLSPCQVILGYNHPSFQIPHENFYFLW